MAVKQSLAKITRLSPWSVAIGSMFILLLAACGGDSGNVSKADGGNSDREVATLVDMGRCTSEREGDTVYVAEKLTDYLCQNNSWEDLGNVSEGENTLSSSSTASDHSSTTPENKLGVSSSSFNKESYTGDNLVVANRTIWGVAQKGPFMFGSPVYLRELSEDSLKYTGMEYKDEINSNKGDFVIPNVNLISPYACIEVRGLYRNEITGEYSKDSISLFALTDLKTIVKNEPRNKVNINLLTHLEYSRALFLIRKGYSVSAAKKQAAQEIMTAFELPTTVSNSEDLSVFEDVYDNNVNYANASLMMLSLLFLGEKSDAEFKTVMDKFIMDFEKDGVWDDAETKAAMADYATEINSSGIRSNVKAWNILDIPKFEEPLEKFWNNMYGLGSCTDLRSGTILKNKNERSKNADVYYKCNCNPLKNGCHWDKAPQIEYDTFGWEAGETCEVRKGTITDARYLYAENQWNEIAQGVLKDSRDGKNYKTVKIGTQTWMAENLNFRYVQRTYKGGPADTSSYCYDNSLDSCAKYGRLYVWSAATDSAGAFGTTTPTNFIRGICPEGWHLPDTTEWKTLLKAVCSENTLVSFGFSILPGGYGRYHTFYRVGEDAYFWSTAYEYTSGSLYLLKASGLQLSSIRENSAYSIRCLKD
ncbi:FISUMP domain-containing protein [Fibrobacter sp.]|uniref:FISUMP domain-containing protein n=1 Tax=Fibrobacter sp. TaxID=35828 RepID=UPI003890CE2C